jgi:outer membrane receptor protein involved in Fe transport
MRGNAEFLVTVNGKFTNQTASDILAQLPANTIESIEIVTSPSASLDAEGKAGIINIVTKKVDLDGWGLVVNTNLSNINPNRYGGDITFYKSKNKFSSFITANFRQYNIGGFRKGLIRTLFQDTITYSPSGGIRPTEEKAYGIRAGTSFNPNKSTSINTGIFYGFKQNDRTAILNYQEFSNAQVPLDLNHDFTNAMPDRNFLNSNLFIRTGKFFTVNSDFTKTYENKNKLSIAAIYEYSVLGGPLTNQDVDESTDKISLKERSNEVSPLDAWRLQADYSIYLNNNTTLETGIQYRTVHHRGDFVFERLNLTSNSWEKDPEFNDNLNLRQSIYAGYLQLNGQYKNVNFKAGLRAEQMFRNLTHTLGTEPSTLNQLDFFPSFQVFWKLKSEQNIKFGYSKRIDRPTTKALAPFKNHRHSEAIWIGDPNLLPEISHNIELGYIKNFEKLNLTLTTYHNRTQNLIFRVNDSYSRITLFTISTNAGNSNSTGAEFTADWQINKKIRFYLSGNIYRFELYNLKNSDVSNKQSTNYNLSSNFSYRFLAKFKWEWNTTYLSKTATAQGFDTDLLLSNTSIKYTHNSQFAFDLIWQNIFNSNVQTINTQNNSFISSTQYSKYDRIIQLSVNYKFNANNKTNKVIKTEYGEKDF